MARLLLFTLAAPLASFGEIAPGERRPTASRPGHATLTGLVAAALGLRREDERQAILARALAFAVRVDCPGSILTDYHTTQSVPSKKGRKFATRGEEMRTAERGTILSQREYRTDCAFTVALLLAETSAFSLEDLALALKKPQFVLSAGRKSCPLALPPSPRICEASTLQAAFDDYDMQENARSAQENSDKPGTFAAIRQALGLLPISKTAQYELAYDIAFVEAGLIGSAGARHEMRRDRPVDRQRWQFSLREELVTMMPASSHPAPQPGGAS